MNRSPSLLIGCAIFFLYTLLCVGPATAAEYSLDDLYRLSLERSERIMAGQEDLFITEKDKERAFSALLPRLTAFGSFTQYSGAREFVPGQVIQPDNSLSWGLRLDQSFSLSARELTAYSISKENIRKGEYDLKAIKEEYLFQVAGLYYDLLRGRKAVEISQANLERLRKHRDAAQIRLKVGEVTKTDLLRAEAQLSGAQSALIRAENSLRLSKALLARTAGIEPDFELKEFPLVEAEDYTLQALRETALQERAEIKASELQVRIAGDQISYAKGAYWPTVELQGVYNRSENNPATMFQLKETIFGGLTLNYAFFEGGRRVAEVRQSESRERQARLRIEDLKKSIGVDVENAYLDFQTQKGVLKSLTDQLTYSRDNFNSISRQYELGLANSIDVIDANTLFFTAERELADARYAYQLSQVKLRRTTGTFLKTVSRQQTTK
ncbi:MAG: TolC family protein [Nitrospirales bacterium]|nr:TolC family protein [Nitrospirales bacterium]